MSPPSRDHHARAGEAFLRARDMRPEERPFFLAGLDEDLRREVERLLRHDTTHGNFLAHPLLDPRGTIENGSTTHEDEPSPPELPPHAGAYRILGTLGDGGSSTVYLAEQTSPVRRQVALKVLRHPGTRGEAAARFRAECEAIARMQHPGIAAMFEASLTPDGRPFFVMEYIAGDAVTEYCRRTQPSLRERLTLFLQIAAAVAHAHQKGVVHRDLKPTNILVATTPEGPIAKVIDFGIAKSLGTPLSARTYATIHGQLVGTLAYMSPEQLAGDPHHVDVRTDIYALGAVLHEMLTGCPAIDVDGMELPAAIRTIEQGQREHAITRIGELPRDLALIIGKAMALEPQRRYQSVLDLAAEVQRYLQNRPVLARGPGAIYIARKFAARHRALVATACITFTLVAASAYSVWQQRERAERHYRVSKAAAMSYLQMVDDVADNIGARGTRKKLLAKAMEQTQAFSAQEASDPEVQHARARVLSALADIEAEEGRTLHARSMFEEVLAVRRRLAAREPHNPERQAQLSFALVRVGDMQQGDRAELALPYYMAALEIDERLAVLEPNNKSRVSWLAWSYQRVGALSQIVGLHEQAARYFGLQFKAIDRLEALGGRVDNVERCRAAGYTHLAREAQRVGDPAHAVQYATLAKNSAQKALAAEPKSRFASMALAGAWFTLGMTHQQLGDWPSMFQSAQESAAVLRPLLTEDPSDAPVLEHFINACQLAIAAAEAMRDEPLEREWEDLARRSALAWQGELSRVELDSAYPLISHWRGLAVGGE